MIGIGDIRRAAENIADAVERNPCLRSARFHTLTGAEVWLKFENQMADVELNSRGVATRVGRPST